jgi:hypothetical protein
MQVVLELDSRLVEKYLFEAIVVKGVKKFF